MAKKQQSAPSKPSWCASIVVLTHNNALNLGELVSRICASASGLEILLVDDESKDGTRAYGQELASLYPIRVIEVNGHGYLTAALRGMNEASNDYCVVMDGDLSHPPEAIPSLLSAVDSGYDLSIGSRYIPGSIITGFRPLRRFAYGVCRLFTRLFSTVRDPRSRFFCLNRKMLKNVQLKQIGFSILFEILVRTETQNFVEIPIHFQDLPGGRSKTSQMELSGFLSQIKAFLMKDDPRGPARYSRDHQL